MGGLTRGAVVLLVGLAVACATDPDVQQTDENSLAVRGAQTKEGESGRGDGNRRILVLDDCDPTDPGWAPTGGCALKRGHVNVAEFDKLLVSTLSEAVIGHPAWRNEPSYIKIGDRQTVHVSNQGGRLHTFTEVAAFGGGVIPPLNIGLTPAPECKPLGSPDPSALPPGASLRVSNLSEGTHLYMCCIHPWMRAAIKVRAQKESDN